MAFDIKESRKIFEAVYKKIFVGKIKKEKIREKKEFSCLKGRSKQAKKRITKTFFAKKEKRKININFFKKGVDKSEFV